MTTALVGTYIKRFEDPRLITGAGTFVDDIKLPGMLYAAVLYSTHAHARIKFIDTSTARKLPGVLAVITSDDLEGMRTHLPVDRWPGLLTRTGVTSVAAPPHPVLARDTVQYVGEPVAIAVANTRYVAYDALELIQVDYEPLPAVMDPEEALTDSNVLHPDQGTNVVLRMHRVKGDVEGAFRQAHKVVKSNVATQRIAPAPMETRGVVVHYDKDSDFITVWSATQAPHGEKNLISHMLGRDLDSIRVVAQDVGGDFGGKHAYSHMPALCYLSIKLGAPIKWIEDRSENMVSYHGRGMASQTEAAVTRDGIILALKVRTVSDLGAYVFNNTIVPPYHMAFRFIGAYKTPAVEVEVLGAATNKPPTGPFRGSGGPESIQLMERTVDLIASELGIEPTEVRRRNFIPPDAFPYTTPTDLHYDSGEYARALDTTVQLAEYERIRSEQSKARQAGRLVGIGVCSYVKGTGGESDFGSSNCRVEIDGQGRIDVYTDMCPVGQGGGTTYSQIAGDLLGLSPDQIKVHYGDTASLKIGHGTAASRGVLVGGSAVYVTVQKARAKLSQLAADLFHCSPDDIEFRDGEVLPRGEPSKAVPFAQVAARAFQEETLPPGLEPGLEFTENFGLPHEAFPFGSWIAEVELDRDTGEVQLKRFTGVHDCGRIMNPRLVEGQIHGGLAQGLGQAMSEGMAYTPDGQPLSGTFMDYAMPFAEDIPELNIRTQETASPLNPLAAKGAGSVSIVGVPVVLTNAVVDALSGLGVTHIDTPLSSEKVWRLLQQSKKK